MSRIFQEGFETGVPNNLYVDKYYIINNFYIETPEHFQLGTGRNKYSKHSLEMRVEESVDGDIRATHIFGSNNEIYIRVYYKWSYYENDVSRGEFINITDSSDNVLASFYDELYGKSRAYIKIGGVLTYTPFVMKQETWYKLEMYINIDTTNGAFEARVDDKTICKYTDVNTGSANAYKLNLGFYGLGYANQSPISLFDDIAINDTNGTKNTSWCGSGSIVGLKPTADGNNSEFNLSQGFTSAETNSTTTTTIVTNHGIATGDIMYNVDRDKYRIVTVAGANTFSHTAITGQVVGDKIITFTSNGTYSAFDAASNYVFILADTGAISYDVFVNKTRFNDIRRIIWTAPGYLVNYVEMPVVGWDDLGETISGQTAGDVIEAFVVNQYPKTDHYISVNQEIPHFGYSNIQSTVSNQIDTFVMEKLIDDKNIPANSSVVAISNCAYVREVVAGSNYKSVLRTNGTNYEGDTVSLADGTTQYNTIYDTNPATANLFTIDEIDSIECGVKVV